MSLGEILFILAGAFLVLWFFGLWFGSRVCGWRRLAEAYPSTSEFNCETRPTSARVGSCTYNGILNVGASEAGLYLIPALIYRPFHPPLLIPWDDIDANVHRARFAICDKVRLTFPVVPRTGITLFGQMVDFVLPYLQRETESPESSDS